jgi:diguanylate cyclase (GGDEF)-like protein/PAS domain S-box-containing protein
MVGQPRTPAPDAPLSGRFFERVVAALGHAVVVTDPDGRVQYWNPAAEELYGYPAAAAVGRPVTDLIVPVPERSQAIERAATLREEPYHGDWAVQDRAGRVFTVQVTSTVILDDDGRPVGLLGVSYDVTVRRRDERDARQLAAIVEGSPDVIIDTDQAGLIRSANAAVGTIFGYDPADLVGRHIGLLISAGEHGKIEAAIACVHRGGSPGVVFTRSPRADGVMIDVALNLSAVHDGAGRFVGISGIARDVTTETRTRAALMASERLLRARFDQSQVPQAMVALDGTLTTVNNAFCVMLGRERAEIEGLHIADLRHPGDLGPIQDRLGAAVSGALDTDTWERTLARGDGSAVPVVIHAAVLRDADGVPSAAAVFLQDLSELRRTERNLTRREALFEALERQANEWATVLDANGIMLYMSPSLPGGLGYDPQSLIGRSAWEFVHPDDLADLQRAFDRLAGAAGASDTVVFRATDAGGHWRWVENVLTNCLGDPDIAGIVCTGRDVTARVEAAQELRQRALRDELTGLANRTLLGDRIEQAVARQARAGGSPFAVVFVDLDQFKLINDSWGHTDGDRLLVQVANRLTDAVRSGDTVARFGGDEFVVVCEDTDETGARDVAQRLQAALAGPFELDGRRAYVGVSIGIAVSPPHSAPDLLRFADAAMYASKSSGPGRVQVFDATLAEEAADRLTLGSDLRDALSHDELTLHYQPVVELATGSLVGLEALARWSHPVRGAVSPARFVAVAENSGLGPALNRWALHRACRDAGLLRGLMHTLPRIAVNISVRHLMDTDLEADVLAAISGGELSAEELVLEITESALMDNPDQTCQLLERLRARGVKTAIDDFGTGYSSLGYLNRLPVTTLKIDRSFIRDITEDPSSLAITASVIQLARSMRLTTIAEGVETVEQLTLLQSLGCWAAQGFLWSPALPPDALAASVNRLPARRFEVGLADAIIGPAPQPASTTEW